MTPGLLNVPDLAKQMKLLTIEPLFRNHLLNVESFVPPTEGPYKQLRHFLFPLVTLPRHELLHDFLNRQDR